MRGWPARRPVPAILMYHSISPYEDDPYDITVRPERFDQQMRWLRRAGRRGTSVGQLLDAHRRGAANGLVGLSFDDGYADFTEYALPVLQRYGFGATMFVPAGCSVATTPGIQRDRARPCFRPASCGRWRPRNRGRLAWLSPPVAARPVPMRTWPGKSGRAGTSSRM